MQKGSVGMPANVESMFSVRQMPWHREGTVLADYPGDWDTARQLAGLDWDPVSTDIYAVSGINPDGTEHHEPVDGWKAVSRSVTGAQAEIRRYTELAQELLAIPITPKQRELFVTEFIPMPPQGLVTDRVARNVEEARAALRLIFESKTTEQVADTGYGLVQGAGEYLDHVRTARSWETRLNRTLIRPEPLKHRALSLVREVVSAG